MNLKERIEALEQHQEYLKQFSISGDINLREALKIIKKQQEIIEGVKRCLINIASPPLELESFNLDRLLDLIFRMNKAAGKSLDNIDKMEQNNDE